MAATLDSRLPGLSALVRADLKIDLEELANRKPATGVGYFDLERLLAHFREIDSSRHDDLGEMIIRGHRDQVRGYVATLDEFVRVFDVPGTRAFLRKKLQAPTKPRDAAPSTEMLDTLAECCWGLWFKDWCEYVEVERPFPDKSGDADFFAKVSGGVLWIDCVSPAPKDPQTNLPEYFADVVIAKWRSKFGRTAASSALPAAVAVNLLKNQENLMPRIVFDQATGQHDYRAPSRVWTECPSLQHAWVGMQSWSAGPQRPNVIANWSRP